MELSRMKNSLNIIVARNLIIILVIIGLAFGFVTVFSWHYVWFADPTQQAFQPDLPVQSDSLQQTIKQPDQPQHLLSATVIFASYKQPIELGVFLDRVLSETRFDPDAKNEFMAISGVISLKITNSDSKDLTGVELFVPRSLFIEMTREGELSKRVNQIDAIDRQIFFSEDEDYINIGELRPQESLVITCWTALSPEDYQYSNFRLIHENGEGVLNFPSKKDQ